MFSFLFTIIEQLNIEFVFPSQACSAPKPEHQAKGATGLASHTCFLTY